MTTEPTAASTKKRGGRARPGSREEAARMHVRGVSNKAIARRLGVTDETVCRWLKEPAVQKRVSELGESAMKEARVELERAALRSAKTLVRIMDGHTGRASKERRLAAEAILDRIGLVRGERREHEHSVQGNPGALAIVMAIEKKRAREGSR